MLYRHVLIVAVWSLTLAGCGGSEPDTGQDSAAVGSLDANTQDAVTDVGAMDGATADATAGVADGAVDDTGKSPALAAHISDLTYGAPALWASPLKDYLAAAQSARQGKPVDAAIHDLMAFGGKLYLGYGDADTKLGATFAVAMRAFVSATTPTTTDVFTSSEAQIDRYRRLDDDLWVPGIAAIEDGSLGNLYRLTAGGIWTQLHAVTDALHVHDVARYDGALWAVGSSATAAQVQSGDVYARVWRSADDGATLTAVAKAWNNSEGDARWDHLLPTSKGLMVFGYRVDGQQQLAELPHGIVTTSVDGAVTMVPLAPMHPLKAVRVEGCWPIGGGRGIVTGVNILQSPQTLAAWLVDAEGATLLPLVGNAIIDVQVVGDEVLLLGNVGATWPLKKPGAAWQVRAWRSSDLKTWTAVAAFSSTEAMTAIAWWRGHVFMGSASGQVWRAAGSWE